MEHVEPVDRGAEDVAQRDEARAGAPTLLGDLEDAPLGLVDELGGRPAFAAVGARGDLAADADQLPQQRTLADDVRVGADVRRGRRVAREARQIGEPAGFLGFALGGEVLGQRDGVARFAARRELGDGREDLLVVAPVEVLGAEPVGDRIPGAVVEQQSAEHGLLGLDGLRRHAQRVRVERGPRPPSRPRAAGLLLHLAHPGARAGHSSATTSTGRSMTTSVWRCSFT